MKWGMRSSQCQASFTDRDDEHRVYQCRLPWGHPGVHEDGTCQWTDATTWYEVSPPLTEEQLRERR